MLQFIQYYLQDIIQSIKSNWLYSVGFFLIEIQINLTEMREARSYSTTPQYDLSCMTQIEIWMLCQGTEEIMDIKFTVNMSIIVGINAFFNSYSWYVYASKEIISEEWKQALHGFIRDSASLSIIWEPILLETFANFRSPFFANDIYCFRGNCQSFYWIIVLISTWLEFHINLCSGSSFIIFYTP